MASVVASLVATLGLDVGKFVKGANDAKKALDGAADAAQKSGKKFSMMSEGVQKASTALSVLGIAGIGFMRSAGRAASDLGEAVNATGLIFGDAAEDMDDFFEGAAKNLGMSERAAREASVQIGALIGNMGFGEEATADWSQTLLELSADLGSAFNKEPEAAVVALAAAIRGETEPIRQFGVMLDDASIRAKAVEMGLADSTAEVDRHGKAQAILAEIMEQTNKVQGDFANTADGLANATRTQAANWEDLQAKLGKAALPMMEKMTAAMNFALTAVIALDDATDGMVGTWMLVASVGGAAVAVVFKLKAAWAAYTASMVAANVATKSFMATMGPMLAIFVAVTAAIAVVITVIGKLGEAKKRAADRARDLQEALAGVSSSGQSVGEAFADAVQGMDVWADATAELTVLGKAGVTVMDDLMKVAGTGTDALEGIGDSAFKTAGQLEDLWKEGDKLNKRFEENSSAMSDQDKASRNAINTLKRYSDTMKEAGLSEGELVVATGRMANMLDEVADATDQITPAMRELATEAFATALQTGNLSEAQIHNADMLLTNADNAFELAEAHRYLNDAVKEVEEAELREALAAQGVSDANIDLIQSELESEQAALDAANAHREVVAALDAQYNAIIAQFEPQLALRQSQRNLRDAVAAYDKAAGDATTTSDELEAAEDRVTDTALRTYAATLAAAAGMSAEGDSAAYAEGQLYAARDATAELERTLGPTNEIVVAMKDHLHELEGSYRAEVNVNVGLTGPGRHLIRGIKPGTVYPQQGIWQTWAESRHAGGVVPGLPGQEVPILARGGEIVVSNSGNRADEAAALGGGSDVTINVTGGMSPEDLAFALAFELENGVLV